MNTRFIVAIPLFLIVWAGACFAGEVVAIVNKKQNIVSLSTRDLQYIFKGDRKKWNSGDRIALFLPPKNSQAMKFLIQKILGQRNDEDLAKFYLAAIFQQKITLPPEPTFSTNDAVWKVSSIPGAISIIDKDTLPKGDMVLVIEIGP